MSKISTLEPVSLFERAGYDDWKVGALFAFCPQREAPDGAIVFLGVEGEFGDPRSPVKVKPRALKLPPLAAVTSDKALYREGDDTVRLLVWSPGAAGASSELTLSLNGAELAKVGVDIDARGLGLYEIRDPVAGEYEATLGESEASFTVAAYKLAPLTARLDSSSIAGGGSQETLRFAIVAETYGAALEGAVEVALMDLGSSPPRAVRDLSLEARAGRIEGEVPLAGAGPFALQLRAKDDAAKTATVPLPGSRASERSELVLSRWGAERFLRGVSFEGAQALRGLYVGERVAKTSAPFRLLKVSAHTAFLEARAEIDAWQIGVLDPQTLAFSEHGGGAVAPGEIIEIPLAGEWRWLALGAISLGRCWEGSAALLLPGEPTLVIEAPRRAEPGAEVTIQLAGPPNASVYLLVKDARLQTADTPTSAAGASLRRQIEAASALGGDEDVAETLGQRFPLPPPPTAQAAPNFWVGALPPVAAPRGGARPLHMPAPGNMTGAFRVAAEPITGAPASPAADPPAPEGPAREEFPEVVCARVVSLDADGLASTQVTLGQAMGSMVIEAFASDGAAHAAAREDLLVSREVFGELVLPRFVADGDFAEGRLYVRIHQGRAQVEILRDGEAVLSQEIEAPGETLSFPAAAGDWEAVVRGSIVDRSRGRVDEPGKLVWLQKAVRILSPGESLARDEIDGALALQVLPSLDGTLGSMVGGLRSYAHCCCEQTSSVLLAAAAAWLTSPDDDIKRDAVNHVRACVDRMEVMHLPGRGFKGWPHYPPEVFIFSPGATLNLLQLDQFDGMPVPAPMREALDKAGRMARDAAAAHDIDPAPAEPASAREAYGRFSKFVDDRQRMAEFIRERIEPWEREMEAILKFELPAMPTESYNRTPAMIRCETAFGAAALIEAGGPHLKRGLALANTVLDAVQEDGRLYSTLDSVAAITMLTAMTRAGVGSGSRCKADGEELSLFAASERSNLARIEALTGPVQVQISRLISEDYTALQEGVTASVWLERGGRRVTWVAPGSALELVVKLESGYEAGDLVHVFLPDALSWVHGGGQVKKFSLDLEGQSEVRVPLAATGRTLDADGEAAAQRFAVCVRNMYDERRGAGFGDLSITVAPGGEDDGGLLDRVFSGLRGLFG